MKKYRVTSAVVFLGLVTSFRAYSKVSVYFSPQGGCETKTIQAINKAGHTIDVAMYRLNNLSILGALEKAKDRGVEIRILVDRVRAMQNKTLLIDLKHKGFDLRVHSRNREQHNSFAVIDGKSDHPMVLTGSYDWYTMAELFNEENCVLIEDEKDLADQYEDRFEKHLWKMNTSGRSEDVFTFMEDPLHAPHPFSKRRGDDGEGLDEDGARIEPARAPASERARDPE